MNTRLKSILFGVLVAFLFLPVAQKVKRIPVDPLKGYFSLPEKPVFSWEGWFEGTWQEAYSKYCETRIGFRPIFIRLKNQLEYTAFRNTSSNVVIGKEDWLYEHPYINAWKGNDFLGTDSLDKILNQMEEVVQYLKTQHTDVIILIAPNKAQLLPQFLPDHFLNAPAGINNYSYLIGGMKKRNIYYLDYNPVMNMHLQENTTKPVYGKYGVHWTYYAGALAADTMVKLMEKIKGVDITDIHFGAPNPTYEADGNDIDLLNLLNLAYIPRDQLFVYPTLTYDSTNKVKPNIIAIADSYHDGLSHMGVLDQVFRTNDLYYYDTLEKINGALIPMDPAIALQQRVAGRDFIVFLYTDQNIPRLGGGFFARMHAQLKNPPH